MKYKNILITGGAGFVGSNLSVKLKEQFGSTRVVAFDNLKRRGSELNLPRLRRSGVEFIHGDIRNKEDLENVGEVDLIIECAAEPSVMAGVGSSPEYLINTNLIGTINQLELARKQSADILLLSTSRVYPMDLISQLKLKEDGTRLVLLDKQSFEGVSKKGISENFPMGKVRSIYGATKLSSELLLQEYIAAYGIRGVINRCGVITGPWQMGKVDQGVIVLWLARHIWLNKPLSYIGYGGTGKQVRDFIHIDDLFEALLIQLKDINKYNGEIFNLGGGVQNSISLLELTKWAQKLTGNKIKIGKVQKTRHNDIPIYITDASKFEKVANWKQKHTVESTLTEIYEWLMENKESLEPILG